MSSWNVTNENIHTVCRPLKNSQMYNKSIRSQGHKETVQSAMKDGAHIIILNFLNWQLTVPYHFIFRGRQYLIQRLTKNDDCGSGARQKAISAVNVCGLAATYFHFGNPLGEGKFDDR